MRFKIVRKTSLLFLIFLVLVFTWSIHNIIEEKEEIEELLKDKSMLSLFYRIEAGAQLSKVNGKVPELQTYCETIHISVFCEEVIALQNVEILIKSLLFRRKYPIHFHFVVKEKLKSTLTILLQTWRLLNVDVSYYSFEDHQNNIFSANIVEAWQDKVIDVLKLTAHDILPHEMSRVIVLDPAIVLAVDVSELWEKFEEFSNEEALGIAEEQSLSDRKYSKMYEHNRLPSLFGRYFHPAVILLNCEILRQVGWTNEFKTALNNAVISNGQANKGKVQILINHFLNNHLDLIYTLPCNWNLQFSNEIQPELCYSNFSRNIKALYMNADPLYDPLLKRFPLVRSLYETMVEVDGDLVRIPSWNCSNERDFDYVADMKNKTSKIHDPCEEFRSGKTEVYRTHVYYLPFEHRQKTKYDVSIVMHLSFDRLLMLERVCKYWKSPASVAVLLTDSDVPKFTHFIRTSLVLKNRRNIGYHLAFRKPNTYSYLTNILRNIALNNAVTEYVFLHDIDFLPMTGLDKHIEKYLSTADTANQRAYVIPAFESYLYQFEMQKNKQELLKALSSGKITTFHSYLWKPAHSPTDFEKWKNSTVAYDIKWAPYFEPYVVVRRIGCPEYDTRFSGFGFNKISFIMELDAAGYTFTVLPFGFIVHMPHSPSQDKVKYMTEATKYRKCARDLNIDFVNKLSRKYGYTKKYDYAKYS